MAAITSAVVGTTAAVAGTVMSFTQAAQQQRNIREAQAKADQAMQEARKNLEVNYYDQLSVMNYDRERLAGLSSGAQLIEAGRESDRGAAATAGRVQAMQNEQQAAISAEQNKQLIEIERMKAMEDSRLRDIRGVQLPLAELQGAQALISDEQQARAASIAQGFQGIGNIATSVDKFVPLYPGGGNKGAAGGSQMTGGGGSMTGGSKMTGGGSLSQQQQIQQQVQNQIAPQRFLFENYNVQNMFNQGTQPNYQFGGTLPASMGGQYDPFNLFK